MVAYRAPTVVRRNLRWFQRSGVMRPADGFWGVAERLAITTGNVAADHMRREFPCFTPLRDGVVAMEHRRADCGFEVAFLFDLAAEALDRPGLRTVADNLLGFLLERSHLRQTDPNDPAYGLWGWASPIMLRKYWTDDNAWVIVLLFKLAARGRPELKPLAVQAARTLHRHLGEYFARLARHGRDMPVETCADIPLSGLKRNPHWLGLACMALAHAAVADPETPYGEVIEAYFATVLDGPPRWDVQYAMSPATGRAWSLSEFAYLGLSAAVVAAACPRSRAGEVAAAAGQVLLAHQQADGHFPAEHVEAPVAPHLADLIYTDNWAVLAFQHLYRLTGEAAYADAARASLRFLAAIQDRSGDPLFEGCWRGMYDTRAGAWGGGDCYEGGANSIYSGWTNAPIAWAFLFAQTPASLFPDDRTGSQHASDVPLAFCRGA